MVKTTDHTVLFAKHAAAVVELLARFQEDLKTDSISIEIKIAGPQKRTDSVVVS